MRLAIFLFAASAWAQSLPMGSIPIGGSAPVTPDMISNLRYWYSSDSGNNCSGSPCTNGANQDTWADRHTPANNLSQSAPCTLPPVFQTAQINGLPATHFDNSGSPQCYKFGSPINIHTTSTLFAVVQDTVGNKGSIVSGTTGSLNYFICQSGTHEQGADKAATSNLGIGTAACDTSWHQINMTYDGSTAVFRIDRASDGSASNSTTITADLVGVAINFSTSAELIRGNIAEIFGYDRVLNSTEIGQLENYLHSRYGL